MPLSTRASSPKNRLNIRGQSTLALAFQAQINVNKDNITIILNIGSVFLHPGLDLVDSLDFTGFSKSIIITNANAMGATTTTAAATFAAVATIATTLPVVFNSRNIPADVCACCDSFNNPIEIMTQKATVAIIQPTGG